MERSETVKKISVLIPTFNEEENVKLIFKELKEEFKNNLENYKYEIIFIDNDSKDKTREFIREITTTDENVKAIFNAKNFGQFNSPFYGLQQTTGDCTILMCADFQDPIHMISKFVSEWENGYKIVTAIKNSSRENKIMYFFRSIYYKLIRKFSNIEIIEHFTGFGLYDKTFINILKKLDDPLPFLRGIVAEFGYNRKDIYYEQEKRKFGKTHNNFLTLYDAAMLSFTSYTKVGLRLATFIGFVISLLCFIIGIVYLLLKLLYWDMFNAGMAPLLIGIYFIGALQLLFIGILGEYILSLNSRIMKRPLVIESERINFK